MRAALAIVGAAVIYLAWRVGRAQAHQMDAVVKASWLKPGEPRTFREWRELHEMRGH